MFSKPSPSDCTMWDRVTQSYLITIPYLKYAIGSVDTNDNRLTDIKHKANLWKISLNEVKHIVAEVKAHDEQLLLFHIAVCQSRGCEFETRLGQHSFRRLTKVIVTSVTRLLPMVKQSMWKRSQLLGKIVVCITGVTKPGHT